MKEIGKNKECPDCERERYSINHNVFICSNPECGNIVGVKYENCVLEPDIPLSMDWDKTILNRAQQVNDDLFFIECQKEKDFLTFRLLQTIARQELEGSRTRFNYTLRENNSYGLYFNKTQYIGFIVWTNKFQSEMLTGNQLYVVRNERRKKYATKMLEYWVENYSDKINDLFIAEDPNCEALLLLYKMGYFQIKNKELKFIKCIPLVCEYELARFIKKYKVE